MRGKGKDEVHLAKGKRELHLAKGKIRHEKKRKGKWLACEVPRIQWYRLGLVASRKVELVKIIDVWEKTGAEFAGNYILQRVPSLVAVDATQLGQEIAGILV
jgi:hypothetical protein